MIHLFDHPADDICPHCVAMRETDRLAELLRDPFEQLTRLLTAPVPVVMHAGDVIFDTFTLNDLAPVGIVGVSRRRRAITITNASAAGAGNAILTREPSTSPTNASAFVLVPQASMTFASKRPLFVAPSVAGVVVSVSLEEDIES